MPFAFVTATLLEYASTKRMYPFWPGSLKKNMEKVGEQIWLVLNLLFTLHSSH